MKPNREVRLACDLLPRQQQVVRLIAEDYCTKEIASKLRLAVKTVEGHRTNAMRRLGVFTVAGVTKAAIRLGMIPNPANGNQRM